MSCFFCSSNDHVTQNCNIYVSDAERKTFLKSKNCCSNCLNVSNSSRVWCINCKNFQKCYCCFSKTHHTVYCSDRFTVSKLFPPNINQNLCFRFLEMLDLEEKYFLVFSFPSILASITLKPLKIKVKYEIDFYAIEILKDFDLVIAQRLQKYHMFGEFMPVKNVFASTVFRIQHLDFYDPSISANEFLQLLSPKTITLGYGSIQSAQKEIEIQQILTFRDILKKAPNLEEITISFAQIKISNSWPSDILEHNIADKLSLYLPISDVNFDIENLAQLFRTKLVKIHLNITLLGDDLTNGAFNAFKKNITKLFIQTECKEEQFICIRYDTQPSHIIRRREEYYVLK